MRRRAFKGVKIEGFSAVRYPAGMGLRPTLPGKGSGGQEFPRWSPEGLTCSGVTASAVGDWG